MNKRPSVLCSQTHTHSENKRPHRVGELEDEEGHVEFAILSLDGEVAFVLVVHRVDEL